jgi:hypothetical protein
MRYLIIAGPAAHKSEAWLETAWEAIDTSMDLVQEQLAMLLHASPANMGQALQQLAELHAVIPGATCRALDICQCLAAVLRIMHALHVLCSCIYYTQQQKQEVRCILSAATHTKPLYPAASLLCCPRRGDVRVAHARQ